MKKLSVIIINYGTQDMTEQVIKTFALREPELDYEVILIDNKSNEELDDERFNKYGVSLIKNDDNLGFAKAVNQGFKIAKGEYVLLLNTDVFIDKGVISGMIEYLDAHPQAAVAAPQMLFPDRKFQISAGYFPSFVRELTRLIGLYKIIPYSTFLNKVGLHNEIDIDWVSGGCMLLKRSVVKDLLSLGCPPPYRVSDTPLMDEDYFLGVEDIDLCYRVKQAGFKIVYLPQFKVVHKHGGSSGSGGTRSLNRLIWDRDGFNKFYRKHYKLQVIRRKLLYGLANLKMLLFYPAHFI